MRDFGLAKFRGLLLLATCAMGAEFLLALADTIVVGHQIGEAALAGVNLLAPVLNLVQFISVLIATGTAVRFSFEVGRYDRRRANEVFSQGVFSALLFGGVLALGYWFGREAFLGFFNAQSQITAYAREYWVWYAPCTVLLPLMIVLTSVVYADGDTVCCGVAYALLLGGNLVASWFLCGVMGVAGCALGTVIGNFAAVLALLVHFLRKGNSLCLVPHFSLADLKLIVKSSFADASVTLCWTFLFLLLDKLVIAEFGSDMLPVLSIVLAAVNLTYLFNGVPAAAQPIVSIYAGERNTLGVRKVMQVAMVISILEGVLVALLFALFPEWPVKLVGIADPQMTTVAQHAVRIVAIGFLAAPFIFLFNSYYLFIERYLLACSVTIVGDLLVYALLCPPLAHWFGLDGLWFALALAPFVGVGGMALFVAFRYGTKAFPLLLSPERAKREFAYGFSVDANGIEEASAAISTALTNLGADNQSAIARGIVKEVFERVRLKNEGGMVMGEASLELNDGVELVLRDDGMIFDPTEGIHINASHFITMGYNRNRFVLS